MYYWLYDIPVLALVLLFAVTFVGLCWLGTILVSPILAPWFQGKAQLNEVLGDYLPIFRRDLRPAARLARSSHLPKSH